MMRWLALALALVGCDRLFGITEIPFAGGDGGTGAAVLQVSDPMVDFGQVEQNKTSTVQTYNVINVGTAPTTALSIMPSGDVAQFTFADGTCQGAVLAPGTGCFIMLTFAPKMPGSFSATFEFQDATTMASLVATGIGLVPGVLAIGDLQPFQTEQVGTTAPTQTVTVTNSSSAVVTIQSITVSGTGASSYGVPGGTCHVNSMLAAGSGSCTMTVGFTPAIGGSPPASLVVTDDAPTGGTSVANLSGTGTSTISVRKAGTGTGTVTSADKMLTCGNACQETVATSSVTLSGTPDANNTMSPWSQNCQVNGASCVVPTNMGTIDVTATFMAYPRLSLAVTGGPGSVTSMDGSINCSSGSGGGTGMCMAQYPPNTQVGLVAHPMNDVFNTWSGACASGTVSNGATCTLDMTSDMMVGANFQSGTGNVLNVMPQTGTPIGPGVTLFVNQQACMTPETGCSYPFTGAMDFAISVGGNGCLVPGPFSTNCTSTGPGSCTISPTTTTVVTYSFVPSSGGSGACAGSGI